MDPRDKRLLDAFRDQNKVSLTGTISAKCSPAKRIVQRYVREGTITNRRRGGANHVRVDDEMRACLNDILNERRLLTLAQINQELRLRLPGKPTIHDRTVARTLKSMSYRAHKQQAKGTPPTPTKLLSSSPFALTLHDNDVAKSEGVTDADEKSTDAEASDDDVALSEDDDAGEEPSNQPHLPFYEVQNEDQASDDTSDYSERELDDSWEPWT